MIVIETPMTETEIYAKTCIIDGQNLFRRSFEAYPSMTINGDQAGGIIGFLKTLKRLVEDNKLTKVIVVWEGGGSKKKRKLYTEYKKNKKPPKLNRFYGDFIPESQDNYEWQMRILINLLKHLPLYQLYVPDVEADDVIGYLCSSLQNEMKIIASSDKDFYQLLNETTMIYSFDKKTYVDKNSFFEEYKITPQNFALAKALCGDASDNIKGVPGIQFKTAIKRFPILGQETELYIQDIVDYAAANVNQSKVQAYQDVLDNIDLIKMNWKLI